MRVVLTEVAPERADNSGMFHTVRIVLPSGRELRVSTAASEGDCNDAAHFGKTDVTVDDQNVVWSELT